MPTTTLGQLLVNDAVPEQYRDYGRVLTKDKADELLAEIARQNPELYRDISWKLMQEGREAAFTEGTTLKLSDLKPPIDKTDFIAHVRKQERRIRLSKDLTDQEKTKALEAVYGEVQKALTDQTYQGALAVNNPFALQVKSKARGNPSQLTAILTTPAVYQDADDRTIPVFIGRSYAEGLDPHEYWAATYGARKSIISTKYATRDAGYLGKQFGVAVNNLVVTEDDCETPQGVPVKATDQDNLGAILARPAAGFPAGTAIDRNVLAKLTNSKVDEIVVRSPMTCRLAEGVCKICTGRREDGKLPEIGHHLGYNAASALAERIAQSQLNQKHSGGQGSRGEAVYSGFDVIEQLTQIPKTFPNRASVAEIAGKVTAIEPAPQGGTNIRIDDQIHYVAPDLPVQVAVGDTVERGDQLSGGIVNPADIVRHKGIGEGRRYFADRLTQAFRESKYEVNRRNVEALARSMIDHVVVDEPTGMGDYLSGDTVKYNAVASTYKPRKNSVMVPLNKAVGQYLEEPVLHHSLGTQLTNNMVQQLKLHGVGNVLVNPEPAGFTPDMVSLVKQPEHSDDWISRLGSNYLESRLLQDVQRGAKSKIHGLNPIPGIAKGTEFGRYKGPGFKY